MKTYRNENQSNEKKQWSKNAKFQNLKLYFTVAFEYATFVNKIGVYLLKSNLNANLTMNTGKRLSNESSFCRVECEKCAYTWECFFIQLAYLLRGSDYRRRFRFIYLREYEECGFECANRMFIRWEDTQSNQRNTVWVIPRSVCFVAILFLIIGLCSMAKSIFRIGEISLQGEINCRDLNVITYTAI